MPKTRSIINKKDNFISYIAYFKNKDANLESSAQNIKLYNLVKDE